MYWTSIVGHTIPTYLVCVPSGGSWAGLALTITNDSDGDMVGLVHDTSVRDSKAVSQFTSFVDGTGRFSVDLIGNQL
jgi:hypothetical protein